MVEILTAPDYHDAAPLVPWLALGYGLLGVYFVPMNGATLGAGRSVFAWVATALSAATNIALLFLLVPRFGLEGAAVCSVLGYLTLSCSSSVWAHRKPNPVTYDWRRIGLAVTAAGLAYVGAARTAPDSPGAALAVQCAWILGFCLVVGIPGVPRRLSRAAPPLASALRSSLARSYEERAHAKGRERSSCRSDELCTRVTEEGKMRACIPLDGSFAKRGARSYPARRT